MVLVISPGASGSSFLIKTISEHRRSLKVHGYFCRDGNDYVFPTPFEKTRFHRDEFSAIYVFANPLDILTSFCEDEKRLLVFADKEGDKRHYVDLLECRGGVNANLRSYPAQDVLNLERHYTTYWKDNGFRCMCIKYEHIHDHVGDLRKFLDISDLQLPEKRQRRTNQRSVGVKKMELIKRTYRTLIQRYEEDSFTVFNA